VLPPLSIDHDQKAHADILACTTGAGNNWEVGFAGLKNAEEAHISQHVLDAIRKRIECEPMFGGFLLAFGTAGGSSSGEYTDSGIHPLHV
jgi:hypothetical protein